MKISERFYNAIEKFFFPKKSADDTVDYTDVAHVNLMGPSSGNCILLLLQALALCACVAMPIDVEESGDGHVFVSHCITSNSIVTEQCS